MTLQGKNALVTGSSRGIGREIALQLARKGENIAVNHAGKEEKAAEVVKEIKGWGVCGIKMESALQLGQKGVNIAVNYAGNEEKAAEVVKEIEDLGVSAIKIQANITDETAVKSMVKEVISTFGNLDILVNNAGITKDNLLM